jgi:hypothetical protein
MYVFFNKVVDKGEGRTETEVGRPETGGRNNYRPTPPVETQRVRRRFPLSGGKGGVGGMDIIKLLRART